MAPHETEGPADSLQFSLDQGACWHTIHLSEAIDIQNIRSHINPTNFMIILVITTRLFQPWRARCVAATSQ